MLLLFFSYTNSAKLRILTTQCEKDVKSENLTEKKIPVQIRIGI